MKAKHITESEMQPLRIASLPTRPTAPSSFGGKGYTSTQMKEAFDLLPSLIASRYNDLLDDIGDGAVAEIMMLDGITLAEQIRGLREEIENLKKQ